MTVLVIARWLLALVRLPLPLGVCRVGVVDLPVPSAHDSQAWDLRKPPPP